MPSVRMAAYRADGLIESRRAGESSISACGAFVRVLLCLARNRGYTFQDMADGLAPERFTGHRPERIAAAVLSRM